MTGAGQSQSDVHAPRKRDASLFWAFAAIAAITLWRVICLALNQVDLFMDEAQYWLWGQEPAFGYFSKPPLIGWAIRASNELGGSDAPFWIRLPGTLAYAVTACLVAVLSVRLWKMPQAAWAGPAFATLPGVAVLSLFISTDDFLFPAFALALLAWSEMDRRSTAGWAVVLGLAVGLGMLTKYAMIYFVGLAGLSMLFGFGRGIPARHLLLAAILALSVFAPNIWWNLEHGLITVSHTAENAGWSNLRLDWAGAGEFLAIQAAAFGPVLAAGYVLAVVRPGGTRAARLLILFSLTLFLAVALQGLIRHANGNWAAPAFVAGTALVVPWMLARAPRWAAVGIGLNAIVAVALPVTTIWPEAMVIGGRNLFERTMGVRDLSEAALAQARALGLSGIAAEDRMVLADLVYRSKGSGIEVYAYPVPEIPDSHYALTRPLTPEVGPVLHVGRIAPDCAGETVGSWGGTEGPDRARNLSFSVLPGPCAP